MKENKEQHRHDFMSDHMNNFGISKSSREEMNN